MCTAPHTSATLCTWTAVQIPPMCVHLMLYGQSCAGGFKEVCRQQSCRSRVLSQRLCAVAASMPILAATTTFNLCRFAARCMKTSLTSRKNDTELAPDGGSLSRTFTWWQACIARSWWQNYRVASCGNRAPLPHFHDCCHLGCTPASSHAPKGHYGCNSAGHQHQVSLAHTVTRLHLSAALPGL